MNHNNFFNPREIESFLRGLDHNYNKKLDTIIKRIKHMSKEVDNLSAQARTELANRIQEAGTDQTKLNQLVQDLRSQDHQDRDQVQR